ncbi:hypothetical protein GOODEAATRI_004042, partial [Goodea atripinnis]
LFDHPGPGSLMNSGNNLHHHHQQQLPGQGHMGFGPPGPPFNQPGQGPLGLFPREPQRPNLPPHQGHQGMANLNQQGGPPNQPRPFMSPRQPFGQQGNMFPPPPVQFGMQVRLRNTPISKQMQHRNSNLRELPVAPGNANMNSSSPAASINPVARTTPGTRPGQNTQPAYGGGRGRGQAAKPEPQAGEAGRADPDEDEETRQYRLKIEEQKRLREEILKRKELRRQMQAGVRKKELLERLNAQTITQNQDCTPTQTQPSLPNQQNPQPVPQQAVPQQPEQNLQQLQAHQQRQVPQRPQQSVNHTLTNPNQDSTMPPRSPAQNPAPRPNVKLRLQMVKGSPLEKQIPSLGPEQQWKQPQHNQQQPLQPQRRNSSLQSVNRPGAQIPQKNPPPSVRQGPAQSQGVKPGAKRTVMQRVQNAAVEAQQLLFISTLLSGVRQQKMPIQDP